MTRRTAIPSSSPVFSIGDRVSAIFGAPKGTKRYKGTVEAAPWYSRPWVAILGQGTWFICFDDGDHQHVLEKYILPVKSKMNDNTPPDAQRKGNKKCRRLL